MMDEKRLQEVIACLRKLAAGIDPLSGEELSEDEVVCNLRISQNLSFAALTLQEFAECSKKNETEAPKSSGGKKRSFTIPYDMREDFPYQEQPVSISQFVKELNQYMDAAGMKKLKAQDVSSWLVDTGILSKICEDGKHPEKIPTEKGCEIGLTVRQRASGGRTTHYAVYDKRAQEYIMEHLDELTQYICEANGEQPTNPSAVSQWADWDGRQDEELRDLQRQGFSYEKMADMMGRTVGGIKSRLKKLEALN